MIYGASSHAYRHHHPQFSPAPARRDSAGRDSAGRDSAGRDSAADAGTSSSATFWGFGLFCVLDYDICARHFGAVSPHHARAVGGPSAARLCCACWEAEIGSYDPKLVLTVPERSLHASAGQHLVQSVPRGIHGPIRRRGPGTGCAVTVCCDRVL